MADKGSPAVTSAASRIGRRNLLKGAALLAGAAPPAAQAAATKKDAGFARGGDSIIARAGEAVVETSYGKVAGYIRKGIFAFKGVPYGASTGSENRFRPPRKPEPWSGVRSSRQYGLICPQDKGTGRLNDEEAFLFQWNDSVEGEDCLRVNVWTPGIKDNGRRPVMVWLHGGGYAAGSGHDLPAFDGENLARRGDAVVVTLNHRLNLLGFLDLSEYGEGYAHSGNAGMLDIVAALEWVRDNIEAFGGDPGRVLIFGQSGGGGKVTALMGMPAAKGLFHRAVVMSGSFGIRNTQEKARRFTELFLAELGVTPADVHRLRFMPYAALRSAGEAVFARENRPFEGFFDLGIATENFSYAPVVDGAVLPDAALAPALSAGVPMIIGTTLNEFVTGINRPAFESMSEEELAAQVEKAFPGRRKAIVGAFRARTPDAKPCDLWSRIATAPIRAAAINQAASKAALNKAAAYLYWFSWRTPVFDGRPRAFHCADIPFVFNNTDRCENMTGGGDGARALSALMADAIVAFARTGDPNHNGLPGWTPFSAQSAPTLIFDDATRLALDPDGEELASIAGA